MFELSNPDSNKNVFSVMVDDWTYRWYHGKGKQDRTQILSEVRMFLKNRRLSEEDADPDISSLKSRLEALTSREEEYRSELYSVNAEKAAISARLDELKVNSDREKHERYLAAKKKLRDIKAAERSLGI